MKNRFGLTYYDRASGELETERVFAASFLYWSYNSRLGRAVTRWILSQRLVSRICGWLARCRFSKRLILPFAKHMDIDLSTENVRRRVFTCFNDFFVGDAEWSSRKDFAGPLTCVSPADGKLLVLPDLAPGESFRIKRNMFNLQQLLADRQLSEDFAGGTAVICRLGLTDYHHFHFPVAGVPQSAYAIKGKLYAGGPYALRRPTSFYAENFRMVTLIDSDLFGTVVQIEIGAFAVGSIRQTYFPGNYAAKGDAKGHFELGGSTVVLIFASGAIAVDWDLRLHSSRDIETRVRVGYPIGSVPASRLQAAGSLHGAQS